NDLVLRIYFWMVVLPSCRYNCGYSFGSCSCSSSCQYYRDCCPDYYDYCDSTASPQVTGMMYDSKDFSDESMVYLFIYVPIMYFQANSSVCGGSLTGSGSFTSPNYPGYYPNNAHCIWYLSAPSGQLEHCCSCDNIAVYDGSSTSSHQLGSICHNTSSEVFHSSYNSMTVVFRSDFSGVARGFRASFYSSLPTDKDNVNIVISTSYLNSVGYSGHDLYLNDQNCRPSISSYQVVFNFPINECGTVREFISGRVMYKNALRAYQSNYGEITRQSNFMLHVGCYMEKDAMAQLMYVANETNEGSIDGIGRFTVMMAFYTSSSLTQKIYDSPYVVQLNQFLYVGAHLRRDDSSLVLFVDTCVASPNPHNFSEHRIYDLIRNGCPRDNTYSTISSGSQSKAGFRFQAFKFLRTHPTVYLQCNFFICLRHDNNSRCRQGCRSRAARDLGSYDDTTTVILGPFKLKGQRNRNISLNQTYSRIKQKPNQPLPAECNSYIRYSVCNRFS
uniref:CUB and zona pellucida-like domains 1, tandem duplicate 1 n=1 Tax=Denticeps clupeoides TaxID=299321 RepID=A0AAY4AZX9_9TELE